MSESKWTVENIAKLEEYCRSHAIEPSSCVKCQKKFYLCVPGYGIVEQKDADEPFVCENCK